MDVTDPVLSDGAAAYTPGISERRSSATKYMHEDFLGSTTRLTDSSQATTDTRQYDAFGNVVSTSGSNPLPFGFAGGWGYQTDSDSGLQLLGHRYYDPSTGRFLTRDPARAGRNWYGYCEGNPTGWIDSVGLDRIILHSNPGGAGAGSHVLLGLEDGKGHIIWFGFYPDEDNGRGEGGFSGPGAIIVGDHPRGSAENDQPVEVSPKDRQKIEKAIGKSRLDYLQGRGRRYSAQDYNCANWVANMLCEGLGWSRPKARILTPERVKTWAAEQ